MQDNEETASQCETMRGVCEWWAINKNKRNEAEAYFADLAPRIFCKPTFPLPMPTSKCVNDECVLQKQNNKEWNPAWRQCTEDSQCRTVRGICGWESINQQHQDEVDAYYAYIGPLIECEGPPEFLHPSPASRCVNGECILQKNDNDEVKETEQ